MGDILDEAANLVQCQECPWYRSCAVPMRMTPEDVRRQMQQAMPGGMGMMQGSPEMIASMMAAAQNLMLEGCPVFIERLRVSPRLAQRIKEIMQKWGTEEEEGQT